MDESLLKRIEQMECKCAELDKTMGINTVLLQTNIEALKKLSESIDKNSEATTEMKITMIAMQGELKDNNREIAELKTKVTEIDNKGKIDFMVIIKDWLIRGLAGGGVVYLILEAFRKIK